MAPESDTLRMRSDLGQLQDLYSFAERQGLDPRAMLVLEEAVVNVITHSDAAAISVAVSRTGETLRMQITDDGAPFDPSLYEPASLTAELTAPGGHGIRLIRAMTQAMAYSRDNNHNILTLDITCNGV